MAMTFDRSQIKDYLNRVDDEKSEFVGAEFCAARLIGYISQQHAKGDLADSEAQQLLSDAQHMMRLIALGKRFAKLARDPSPEIRIMVLADEAREQTYAQQRAK